MAKLGRSVERSKVGRREINRQGVQAAGWGVWERGRVVHVYEPTLHLLGNTIVADMVSNKLSKGAAPVRWSRVAV